MLWVSTQAPHVVRRCVAGALGLATNRVRVITPYVGGGFGPKGRPYPEEIAVAALAMQLGRPCRWEATRREDFQSTYHGHGLGIDAELAARSDGTILGLRARILQDAGAYLLAVLIVPQYASEHLIGPYHVPAADVQAVAVYTNKAGLTPVRGGGREQGVFVIERLLDHLARKIGIDPVEVRRRNTLHASRLSDS
jgi:CO/xanthine dehydrogenase Mo-binding subunit